MFYIYCTKQLQVSGTYRGNLQGFASTCTAYMELVIDHCILTTLHYIYIYIVCQLSPTNCIYTVYIVQTFSHFQGFASTCTAYMELVKNHCILTTLYIYIHIYTPYI